MRLQCDGTFVMMSTKGSVQPDGPPCLYLGRSQQEHQSTAIDHLSSLRQFQTDMSVQQSEKLDQIMSKGSDPLGEFTARGVLATLQDIELKVANISAKQHQQISRHRTSLQQV